METRLAHILRKSPSRRNGASMRKIIAIILLISLCLSLSACRSDKTPSDTGNASAADNAPDVDPNGIFGEEITSKNKLSDSTDTDSRGGVFRTVDEGDYGFAVYEDSGKVSVYAYYGTDKNVTTPYKFNGTVVTEIFGGAFAHTSVVSVSVSEGVTFIGEGAFTGSHLLEKITLPSTVTEINDGAFYGCPKLIDIKGTAGLKKVGGFAFNDTPWYDTISDEFAVIGDGILIKYGGAGGNVTIPEGVKSIVSAFRGKTDVTGIEFGSSVLAEIGYGSFDGCTGLHTVVIPDSVKKIGIGAFANCTSLEEVTLGGGVTEIGQSAFLSCDAIAKVKYTGSESDWEKLSIGEGNERLTEAKREYGAK